MAYILVVNPAILATEGTGLESDRVLTATVLVCFSSTLLMGLYARLPYAIAPGMGLNAFFTYTLVLGQGVRAEVALGLVFWSGVVFLVLSVTPAREAIANAIPASLRSGAAAGIGIFLTFIGLENAGVVVAHPVTLVTFGELDHRVVFFAISLAVAAALLRRKHPLALLASVGIATLLGALTGDVTLPETPVATPDFGGVLAIDPLGALSWALVPALVALVCTDLFDSLSTFVGVADATGLHDADGKPTRLREGLIVDALATMISGLVGSSPGTTYIESASGIEAGGRSGRTAIVCALCFVPCLFLAPIVGAIPSFATAPVLVLVGATMFGSLFKKPLEHVEDLVPLYLTAVLIPLTFSITQGILWGFIAHVVLYALCGRHRELHPMMVGLGVLAALLLAFAREGGG